MHQKMAATLEEMLAEIRSIQDLARKQQKVDRPRWPLLILKTPKGWTGPKEVDGKPVEGTWRAHQVPISDVVNNPEHLQQLEDWLKSYKPHELFGDEGLLRPDLQALAPTGHRRMGMNPHANGGLLLRPLVLPDFERYAVKVQKPGGEEAGATRVLGSFLRDVFKENQAQQNFRLFGPDETASNRLDAVYGATNKEWMARIDPVDIDLATDGRVLEVLSEHMCEGWLEGYLLTGRHGFFSCYEAFIHIVDSMFNQHAKWLKTTRHISWRAPIPSLNYLLSSHVWRQDHNGFSHQDPGFIDHVANKKADVVRIYLPPDANTLLSVADHCLRSRNYVNLIIAGKQPAPVWLDIDSAVRHCTKGLGTWDWASNGEGKPDVVMACCGDVPTRETLAAVTLLRQYVSDIRVRVVNVVDLMTLQPSSEHPHGLPDDEYDEIFGTEQPIIFAFHGYPWLIHRLTYRRHSHDNLHVRGYKEEGTTTTPFDMTVLNQMDRFQLAFDAIRRIPRLASIVSREEDRLESSIQRHKLYVMQHGEDMPEIRNWKWICD
jgi:xylulose-5-phosphate/fructose-6-phosphate phosphoketolase